MEREIPYEERLSFSKVLLKYIKMIRTEHKWYKVCMLTGTLPVGSTDRVEVARDQGVTRISIDDSREVRVTTNNEGEITEVARCALPSGTPASSEASSPVVSTFRPGEDEPDLHFLREVIEDLEIAREELGVRQ